MIARAIKKTPCVLEMHEQSVRGMICGEDRDLASHEWCVLAFCIGYIVVSSHRVVFVEGFEALGLNFVVKS